MNKLSAFMVAALFLNAFAVEKRPFDFVVGVDGNFKAAMSAAAASGASENKQFVIFFPDGEYDLTNLTADSHGKTTFSTSFVSLIGQTRDKAIIANKTDTEGISLTATLYFPKNNGMYLQDLTIQNKSSFAVSNAARQVTVQQIGDKYIFKNVRLLSGQDTYYTNKGGRTYWEGGEIQGTVDFICGDGDVFFEGTNIVMARSGGYVTAAKTSTEWGYVFNNAKLNVSNSSFNGTFYLGRSWGHAKTVFLNTTMYAQPKAEGWGPDMNSAPDVYGEYNSKNGSGGAVDVSKRKTYFSGGKDSSTANLKTVWNASDAAKYTLQNVLGGTDNWAPNKLTQLVAAPKIIQEGDEITWDDQVEARCWAVFVNGKYKGNVATNSYSLEGVPVGAKVTVRSANSMGGLGGSSNEIAVEEANVNYYKLMLDNSAGGIIQSNVNSVKIAEGKVLELTAKANSGWNFEGWGGKSSSLIDASATSVKLTVFNDVELFAKFSAKGLNVFQAEDGLGTNVSLDNNNLGFNGTGFVNFGAGDFSQIKVPVYVETEGTYNVFATYANGSGKPRSLQMVSALECQGGVDGCNDGTTQEFAATANWTTWEVDSLQIKLPAGASYLTFATMQGNDGPNLDQIQLVALKTENDPDSITGKIDGDKLAQKLVQHQFNIQLFTLQGKLLRSVKMTSFETDNLDAVAHHLPAGNYLMRISTSGFVKQKIIQVK